MKLFGMDLLHCQVNAYVQLSLSTSHMNQDGTKNLDKFSVKGSHPKGVSAVD